VNALEPNVTATISIEETKPVKAIIPEAIADRSSCAESAP
jgi:hypothetical protein